MARFPQQGCRELRDRDALTVGTGNLLPNLLPTSDTPTGSGGWLGLAGPAHCLPLIHILCCPTRSPHIVPGSLIDVHGRQSVIIFEHSVR